MYLKADSGPAGASGLDQQRVKTLGKLMKYRLRGALESGKGLSNIPISEAQASPMAKLIIFKERYRLFKRKYGNIIASTAVIFLNVWLLFKSLDVRKIDLVEEITRFDYKHFDSILMLNLVLFTLFFFANFKYRFTSPGYLSGISYNS